MKDPAIIKSISINMPLEDWKALRLEAAQKEMPVTELCRRQLQPYLNKLKRKHPNT